MSAKGYEIPLSVPGAEEALRTFDRLADKMRETSRAALQSVQAVRTSPAIRDPWERSSVANARVNRMLGMGLSDSDIRLSRLEQVRAQRAVNRAERDLFGIVPGGTMRGQKPDNAWDRLSAADANLALLTRTGARDSVLRGARLEQVRAQRAVDRGEKELNPQEPDPIRTMFMRTRLRVGPWQPLVGDLVKNGLLDPSKVDSMIGRVTGSPAMKAAVTRLASAALPVMLGAGAIAAVGYGAYQLMEDGLERSRALRGAHGVAGFGNGMATAQAAGIGSMFGMDAGSMAGRASALGDRLQQGGFGSGVMRGAGINDLGMYTLDKMGNMIKVLDRLRKMDERTAVMVARDLGIDDMLSVRDVSDPAWNRLKKSIGDISPMDRRQGANYDANVAELQNRIGTAIRGGSSPLVKGANAAFEADAKGFGFNPLGATPLAPFYELYRAISKGREILDRDGNAKSSPADSALQENTKALRENYRALQEQRELIGGGSRAANAIPAGWKGTTMEMALLGHAQGLGAFTIG